LLVPPPVFLPIVSQIFDGERDSFVVVLYRHFSLFSFARRIKYVTVREVVSGIIPHNWPPLVIEATLQLHHKFVYPVPLQLKPDTSGILVVEETTEFNGSQEVPPRRLLYNKQLQRKEESDCERDTSSP
jgi:hypothetical protein